MRRCAGSWGLAAAAVALLPLVGCGGRTDLDRRAPHEGVGASDTGGSSSLPEHEDGTGADSASAGRGGAHGRADETSGASGRTGGAGGLAGAAPAGAGGVAESCLGKIRENGVVPLGVGAPGAGGDGGSDPCEPNPCEKGAVCVAHRERALCDCGPGTFGDRCELGVKSRLDWRGATTASSSRMRVCTAGARASTRSPRLQGRSAPSR
jgi:hypothetical protein